MINSADIHRLDAEFAAKIAAECHTDDPEGNHGDADEILIELLYKLGFSKTADAWNAVQPKWYG